MSEPRQEFLRRGQVFAWLEGEGITEGVVLKLIANGTIKGAPLLAKSATADLQPESGNRQPERKKKTPKLNGHAKAKLFGGAVSGARCYFRKSQIKEALKI